LEILLDESSNGRIFNRSLMELFRVSRNGIPEQNCMHYSLTEITFYTNVNLFATHMLKMHQLIFREKTNTIMQRERMIQFFEIIF